MYRILGADGREYSAASADQLRDWIAQRRADGHTRVLPPNGTEWVTLAALPEFAGALAAAAATPGAPAKPPPLEDPEKLAAAIVRRDYRVCAGSCLGRGWDLLMANFWLLVGAEATAFVIMGAAGAIPYAGAAVARHWWHVFWLVVCCGVVTLAGLLLACVGVFVTAPVATAALMYAYEDVFGQKSV